MAVKRVLPRTMGARLDTDNEVAVGSAPMGSVIVPAEPATLELASGVKVAVSCAGDASAENETWQVAVGLEEDNGSFEQEPPIGPPNVANVTDPDIGAALPAGGHGRNQRHNFICHRRAGRCRHAVKLGPAVWPSWAWPLTPALVSVAVIVTGPGVVVLWICAE